MTAKDYGTIVNGVCTGMIVLDPDTTDPIEFGKAIGAELIARDAYLDGHWGAGALWDGKKVTLPPTPPAPADPPAPSMGVEELQQLLLEQRDLNASQQTQLDDLTTMILEG